MSCFTTRRPPYPIVVFGSRGNAKHVATKTSKASMYGYPYLKMYASTGNLPVKARPPPDIYSVYTTPSRGGRQFPAQGRSSRRAGCEHASKWVGVYPIRQYILGRAALMEVAPESSKAMDPVSKETQK